MFRFVYVLVFIFLVQAGFAQFPIHRKECGTVEYRIFAPASPQNNSPQYSSYLDSNEVEHYVAERNDTVYYCAIENGEYSRIVQLSELKGKNPAFWVNENGEFFACWINPLGLVFQRSTDYGKTWLPEEKFLAALYSGSEYKVDSVVFKNNPLMWGQGEHLHSRNEFKNRIYVCWTDAKYSLEDKDIFLMYSDDKGEHWTEPILVTYGANHKAQFSPRVTERSSTGNLYLLYYDKQNYVKGKLTDITLAVSENGGLKFDYYRVNEKSFLLSENSFLSILGSLEDLPAINWNQKNECFNITLYEGIEREYKDNYALQVPKSISFSKKIILPIALQDTTTITAVITKPLDPYFEKVVFTGKKFGKGKNEIMLDTKKLSLEKGNYTLFLYYNSHNKFVWIVDE